jgi:hypothetical protein
MREVIMKTAFDHLPLYERVAPASQDTGKRSHPAEPGSVEGATGYPLAGATIIEGIEGGQL